MNIFPNTLDSLIKKLLLRDSIFLIIFKTLYKFLSFVFILIVARYLTQEDFGDFQFVISFKSVFTQMLVVITLVIARTSCSFPQKTQKNHLRWLYQKGKPYLFSVFILMMGSFYLIDSWVIKIASIKAAGSITVAGLAISLYLIMAYYLGFLQAMESFRIIGLLFFFMGFLIVLLGLPMIWYDVGILYIYFVYVAAFLITLVVMMVIIDRSLPKKPIAIHDISFSMVKYSVFILLSIGAFFTLFIMDIIGAKLFFSRIEAGYYARLEIIGKISFILSTSIAMVVFPKVSKVSEQGKDPISYLIKGSCLYFVLSFLMTIPLLFFSEEFFHAIFRINPTEDSILLVLIVVAKIFQSFIFILINYQGALMNRWMLFWLGFLVIFQSSLFFLNHDSLLQIGTNIFISSILGACILFGQILYKRSKSPLVTQNALQENSHDY